MKLTWRDVPASALVLAGLALANSVVMNWGWPLLNGPRAGIIALAVCGIFACSISGWADEGGEVFKRPLVILGSVLGVALLAIGLIGLIVGTVETLEWMMAAFAALWIITVIDKSVVPAPTRRTTA